MNRCLDCILKLGTTYILFFYFFPHPEPPLLPPSPTLSHLPPHPIPLGHPSALIF